ncbi:MULTISPECIES: fimbria/pilus outer membrane usher protein [Enterobacterales]|uniref:fimbria/pilus outer membrane usher protein n=1 Tax=Enterobacterales TaxID=91347 RepID=UPI002ED807B8
MSTIPEPALQTRHRHASALRFRCSLLSLALAGQPALCLADDTFSLEALEIGNPDSAPVDLSLFSREEGQLPGEYPVELWCNNEFIKKETVTFVLDENKLLAPQLSPSLLEECGVNRHAIPALEKLPQDEPIKNPQALINNFSAQFDFNKNRLNISVPQALMNTRARGTIDPRYWDDGIPALFTSYSYSGSQAWTEQGRNENNFLSLRNGMNLGSWRVRNYSTWSYSKSADGVTSQSWASVNSWLQRDVRSIKGTLVAGESYSSSELFDSLQFTGVQLASNDGMLSDSQRGFAPTVKGIANSNARITVYQNGIMLYQTNVPPGPFVISDLYPTSSGGELDVEIQEADGSTRHFIQPFSDVPMMQREGQLKYAFIGGKLRNNAEGSEPNFGQITLMYGLPYDLTLYGGGQLTADYQATLLGVGITAGSLGAVSMDVTQAKARLLANDSEHRGQSVRFQYAKTFTETDTNVQLAGYRYSTSGFYTLSEANEYQEDEFGNAQTDNKRSKLQIDFSQQLNDGEWGGLALSGWKQSYWGQNQEERGASVSYNSSMGNVSYSLMYTYSKTADSEASDQRLSLSISLPLAQWLPGSYASWNLNTSRSGNTSQNLTVNGTALEDKNLTWGVGQGYTHHGDGNSGQANASYKGGYGNLNAGYSYDQSSQQMTYGMDSAVMVHPWGLTLSQPFTAETNGIALIKAPGAADVGVKSGTGVRTDWRGYTVQPYVTPYRKNNLTLDSQDFDAQIDVDNTMVNVIPTGGAVVLANYPTHIGARVLLTLTHPDGRPLPFGAVATQPDDSRENIVGEEGQVFMTGVAQQDSLTVKWGDDASERCQTAFTLPPPAEPNPDFEPILQLSAICQ